MAEDHLTVDERAARGSNVGCIAGALSIGEFEAGLLAAGLADVSVQPTQAVAEGMHSAIIRATKPAGAVDVTPASRRPLAVASGGCCGGDACC